MAQVEAGGCLAPARPTSPGLRGESPSGRRKAWFRAGRCLGAARTSNNRRRATEAHAADGDEAAFQHQLLRPKCGAPQQRAERVLDRLQQTVYACEVSDSAGVHAGRLHVALAAADLNYVHMRKA